MLNVWDMSDELIVIRTSRAQLAWQLCVFQFKLGLEGLKDLVLAPLSLVAGLIGIFSKNPDERSSLFRKALRLGRAWDDYIDLYSSLEREEGANKRSDRLDEQVLSLERTVVGQTDTSRSKV